MRIITVEEHFQHPEVVPRVLELSGPPSVAPDDGFGPFLQRFMPDRDSAERLGGQRLAHMDRAGIDIQVVSHGGNNPGTLDHPEAVELCRKVNDELARQIAEHPTRFRGFATIPLHDPAAAADEMRRCVNELGFVGTLVMGTCGGLFLDDERFEPVLAAAEEVDLPIYVHPGMPQAPCRRRTTREVGRRRFNSGLRERLSAGMPRQASTFCASYCRGPWIGTRVCNY